LKAKYTQRFDGEDFDIPTKQIYRIACCDCGLVHDFVFVAGNVKKINVATERNKRATAQRRRYMRKQRRFGSELYDNIKHMK